MADIDGDGRPEICVASDDGKVHVFEASANDVWAETDSILVGIAATAVKAGPDVDGNGKPEFHVSGSGPLGWTTQVYEATDNDTYTQIATVSVDDGYFGLCFSEVADVDGDGHLELMMSGAALYAFEWSLGWQLAGQIDDPDGGCMARCSEMTSIKTAAPRSFGRWRSSHHRTCIRSFTRPAESWRCPRVRAVPDR